MPHLRPSRSRGAGHRALGLDPRDDRFGLRRTAHSRQPAWRFRDRLANEPDDQRPHPGNDEHRAPARPRDNEPSEERRQEQGKVDDEVQDGAEPSAAARWDELAERAVANDDLRPMPRPIRNRKPISQYMLGESAPAMEPSP